VISINVATYWHTLRTNGITDKLYGFTGLFSKF
jgi:maleate isomerase